MCWMIGREPPRALSVKNRGEFHVATFHVAHMLTWFDRTTGGRKAAKTQRRLEFSIHDELEKLSTL